MMTVDGAGHSAFLAAARPEQEAPLRLLSGCGWGRGVVAAPLPSDGRVLSIQLSGLAIVEQIDTPHVAINAASAAPFIIPRFPSILQLIAVFNVNGG
ncbi:hypothetical protein CLG96_08435 [Sphingomonas oleivorans]|uniref:Uncharacterized protein n=1 Tax=Sphingomonas oleivorans TaxID=1735121 RepID=A0A2T5FY96_9SPHN|nr:hypothetical protein [Sphingomonas oleivorans]PTQ11464.1 hypothetical protein CLG96_08435 [Sphingomonas oleivorans]